MILFLYLDVNFHIVFGGVLTDFIFHMYKHLFVNVFADVNINHKIILFYLYIRKSNNYLKKTVPKGETEEGKIIQGNTPIL